MRQRRTTARPAGASGWTSASERGSALALRFVVWCFRRLGRAPTRVLLVPIATYYTLFAGPARRASRAYLTRVRHAQGGGARPGLRDAYRHFHTFAEVILDRFCFWAGAYDDYEIVLHGREHMEKHLASGGAFLVGAHLGSFDVLRVIARDAGVRVNVLMFTANASRINQTLEALDPDSNVRIIELDPGSVRSVFEVRRRAARGEFVAVLADRVHPGARGRVDHASFLGEQAPFPQGPFLLPMLLGLPVVLTLALKTGPRSYDVFLETLAEAGPVSAQERGKLLRERIETYAARLEQHCLRAPYQWFNFYDFWGEGERERD